MRTARRNRMDLVLDLAGRLAEEFDRVPLPMVSRTVRRAVEAAQLFDERLETLLPTIERIAREDLAALHDAEAAATG